MNAKDFKSNVRLRWEEGKLTLQAGGLYDCLYQNADGKYCAIGSGLSDETIDEIIKCGLNGEEVENLLADNVLSIEGDLEFDLTNVQWCYDNLDEGESSWDTVASFFVGCGIAEDEVESYRPEGLW